MANNREPLHPKSVYIHKRNHGKLVAGPVWDFDWGTFDINRNGLTNWNVEIFKNLTKKKHFRKILFDRWENDKLFFMRYLITLILLQITFLHRIKEI